MKRLGLLAVMILALSACGSSAAAPSATTAPTSTTATPSKGSAKACENFRTVVADFQANKTSVSELAGHGQSISNDASSATPAVKTAAAHFLAATQAIHGVISQETAKGVDDARAEMSDACAAAGV